MLTFQELFKIVSATPVSRKALTAKEAENWQKLAGVNDIIAAEIMGELVHSCGLMQSIFVAIRSPEFMGDIIDSLLKLCYNHTRFGEAAHGIELQLLQHYLYCYMEAANKQALFGYIKGASKQTSAGMSLFEWRADIAAAKEQDSIAIADMGPAHLATVAEGCTDQEKMQLIGDAVNKAIRKALEPTKTSTLARREEVKDRPILWMHHLCREMAQLGNAKYTEQLYLFQFFADAGAPDTLSEKVVRAICTQAVVLAKGTIAPMATGSQLFELLYGYLQPAERLPAAKRVVQKSCLATASLIDYMLRCKVEIRAIPHLLQLHSTHTPINKFLVAPFSQNIGYMLATESDQALDLYWERFSTVLKVDDLIVQNVIARLNRNNSNHVAKLRRFLNLPLPELNPKQVDLLLAWVDNHYQLPELLLHKDITYLRTSVLSSKPNEIFARLRKTLAEHRGNEEYLTELVQRLFADSIFIGEDEELGGKLAADAHWVVVNFLYSKNKAEILKALLNISASLADVEGIYALYKAELECESNEVNELMEDALRNCFIQALGVQFFNHEAKEADWPDKLVEYMALYPFALPEIGNVVSASMHKNIIDGDIISVCVKLALLKNEGGLFTDEPSIIEEFPDQASAADLILAIEMAVTCETPLPLLRIIADYCAQHPNESEHLSVLYLSILANARSWQEPCAHTQNETIYACINANADSVLAAYPGHTRTLFAGTYYTVFAVAKEVFLAQPIDPDDLQLIDDPAAIKYFGFTPCAAVVDKDGISYLYNADCNPDELDDAFWESMLRIVDPAPTKKTTKVIKYECVEKDLLGIGVV